jgi:predicted nucleotidyltransferase
MRISQETAKIIKELSLKYFGEDSKVYLFGSRADDTKRGGDIDIYVETKVDISKQFDLRVKFLTELTMKIGEQKIDIVINNLTFDKKLPIYEIAKRKGVLL